MPSSSSTSNSSSRKGRGADGNVTDFQLLGSGPPPQQGIDCGRDEKVYGFRVKGKHIKYVLARPDDITECNGIFPPFPGGNWNVGGVAKRPGAAAEKNELVFTHTTTSTRLPGVRTLWHPVTVALADLVTEGPLSGNGHATISRVTHPRLFPEPVVLKVADVPAAIERIETETRVYQRLAGHGDAPRFLAHVAEADGRVVGFLLEYIEGAKPMTAETATACCEALTLLHQRGVVHGDVFFENFLCREDEVFIVDFEFARLDPSPKEIVAEFQGFLSTVADVTVGY